LIHEFGHTMELMQPGIPNYFSNSEEERGGDPSNHCFGPLCIMSVRNIEAELRVGRYADYRTEPDAVFCKSCVRHLETVRPHELPWYNQVRTT
jgi:hypothetical protein